MNANHPGNIPKDKERKERNELIISKNQAGISVQALANEFNLTRDSIYKILKVRK